MTIYPCIMVLVRLFSTAKMATTQYRFSTIKETVLKFPFSHIFASYR
jgi:hypothetical protein